MLAGRHQSTGRRVTLLSDPRLVVSSCNAVVRGLIFACSASLFMAGPAQASPPGAVITNQATFNYQNLAGQPEVVPSNPVSVVTAVVRSSSSIEFTRVLLTGTGAYQEPVGPAACFHRGAFVLLADPMLSGGTTIDPTQVQEVDATSSYNLGEPLFLRLTDSDQNVDYQIVDTVSVDVVHGVSGDSETIQLSETGVDTGIFAGFVPSAQAAPVTGDLVLQGSMDSTVRVTYVDPADAGDTAEDTANLDPVSNVFESRTGSAIDGIQVELVDALTGLPALVFGNDGISTFPSLLLSGSTVTDSSGANYVFGTGEYRFPVVANGDYRLIVTPPATYAAPSSATIADLQLLPGAPYALGPESFGAVFTQSGPEPFDIDIPIDPQSSALFLQKRTLTSIAAPGDFVRYELILENSSATGTATDIMIVDQLPTGVRFVSGSVRVDGDDAPDPVISGDATTLEFSIGALAVAARVTISYVVEIIGGERNDELINTATAFAAGGLLSNESTAAVLLTEDMFRATATIIGRVLEADCSQETFSEEQGVAGIRIYLEDGRYTVTDAGGRYHFEGIEPGTHVAQLDTVTIPEYFDAIGCALTTGFAGRADSQFVKLSRGSMHRADFYLRRKEPPHGRIDIEMRNVGTDSAERVAYKLTLNGIGNVEIDNISLTVVLPKGIEYLPGTLRINGVNVGDPHFVGPSLSMAIDAQSGNWSNEIGFSAIIDDQVDGELVTKAIATFDTPMEAKRKTPVVETKMIREPAIAENDGYMLGLRFAVLSDDLAPGDQLLLDRLVEDWQGVREVRLSVIGHSDSQRISPRNRHLFADNYALSQARAFAAAFYVARLLNIPERNIQVEGRGPDDPVADNATATGRQKNRRVEMILSGIRPKRPSFLEVTQESSGTKETATIGAIPGMENDGEQDRQEDTQFGMPSSQAEPPINSLTRGYAMLLPDRGFAPAIPATKVSIQHEPGQTVELTLNGEPVSQLNLEGVATNAAGTVTVTRWIGVDLVDGANELRAVIWNADGSKAKSIRRTIQYSGAPLRAEFVAELSTLIADGRTKPVIALRLFDRSGKPSRAGIVGRFSVNPPYRSAWDEANAHKNVLVEVGNRSASYRVAADGIAYLELAPTTRTGEATVVLPFANYREQEIRAWLKPAQRDWILVGFAEGTAGFNTLSDNLVAAAAAGHGDGYYDEGRVAFFAKGSIKGAYLLTLAFDSARDRASNRDRFQTLVDPNAYYSLYADTSEQRFEAASQRKLYVKIERNQFYALFGDFDTGLSVTSLARYQRHFNGLKSEYRGRNVSYTVFAAETDQSFNRDEIRGDGTSGLYHLNSAPIIANSENIRIEVRDRFDTGVVLSSQTLTRFLDYNLDTLSGTVYFKKPVPSRDFDFNPVYIVIEYESILASTEDIVAGGRGALRFANDSVEVGVTHINDATAGAEADLSGVDLRWQINEQTLFEVEIATSNATIGGVSQSGSASTLGIEHSSENLDVRAFISAVDDGFGLGYQSAAEKGVRRLGIDARVKFGERFMVEGEASWQQNLQTDAIRNVARARVRYERDNFTARLGLTHAEDAFDDGETLISDVVELGLTQKIFDGNMRLRMSTSTTLSQDAANVDYPTSLVVGADYRVFKDVDLVVEYEKATGRDIEATMTRVGVRASPWSRGQINTFLSNETTEFGPRLFANVGLVQGFQLNEHWVVDVGVDHTKTLLDSGVQIFDPDRELVSGSFNDDFVAAYAGATYTSELWSANSRIEIRNSDAEERLTLLLGWYRQPSIGHGLSAGLTMFKTDNTLGGGLSQTNLRFGWAYRAADSKWSFLDRIDLVSDRFESAVEEQTSWRVINNFNANRRLSAATQLSLQYAFKYVRSNFDGDDYSGYTDLIGIDLRHGFRGRWDVGASTSVYHSYRSRTLDYGIGLDVGYNVVTNFWLTLGYNFAGFDDKDFAQARYTAAGPFLRFTFKADQGLLKRVAGRR